MLLNLAATYAAGIRAAVNGGRGWLAVVLMVAVLAICALSVNRYVTLERELTDSALARRAVIGSLAATALSDKFERLTDVGIALATRVRFQELVGAGRWSEAAQILRRVPEDFAFVDRVFIADLSGTLMADMPELPGVIGTNFAHRDWFKGVSRDWKPYISDLYRRTAEPKRNVIAVSVPIRDAGAGIAVLRQIKADERTRVIPVVVMTSSNEERDVMESYRLGANSYIVKPIEFGSFLEVVAKIGLYWVLTNRVPD